MKERLILFCMLLLCGIGVSRAQSGNAKDFDQKEETIVQKLQQAVNEKNYKEAEKNGKALITLFKEQDENTQKKYSWLIQSYYYNLACFQSLLKKKGEAIKNLELAYDNGFQDYNHMMNDTDLDNLRSDKRFKAVLAKVKKVGDYLKNLELGYTLPQRWTTKIGIRGCRLFARGTNLLTFSNFKLWDPELETTDGLRYPQMKSVSVGFSINFNN